MTGIRQMFQIVWHDANQEKLKTLWTKGLSAAEISKEFPGSTRNGILGKIHRMGLSRTRKPIQTLKPGPKIKPKRKNPMVVKPIVVSKPLVEPIPPTGVVNFLEMGPGTCRSVEGYSKQNGHYLPFYCGNPKSESFSFCLYHHNIYYRKNPS